MPSRAPDPSRRGRSGSPPIRSSARRSCRPWSTRSRSGGRRSASTSCSPAEPSISSRRGSTSRSGSGSSRPRRADATTDRDRPDVRGPLVRRRAWRRRRGRRSPTPRLHPRQRARRLAGRGPARARARPGHGTPALRQLPARVRGRARRTGSRARACVRVPKRYRRGAAVEVLPPADVGAVWLVRPRLRAVPARTRVFSELAVAMLGAALVEGGRGAPGVGPPG